MKPSREAQSGESIIVQLGAESQEEASIEAASTKHYKLTDMGPLPKRPFHAMVKPTGSTCNLDCAYCYYLHKEELVGSKGRMPDELLETHIRQYIAGQDGDEVVFSWQGGEPTLLGLGFFRKVIELEQKYKKPGQRIENDLQTNGTLLDEEWAKFLKANGFLVGLSIDGPKHLHDLYRVTKGGQPTFDKVLAAARLLHKHGVPFNTLTVVNRENAKYPREVYRFLAHEVRPRQLQFIPCVEPKSFTSTAPQRWTAEEMPILGSSAARPGTPDSVVTDWTVDPDDYGSFLCGTFDEWYRNDVGKVFVNVFENFAAMWQGMSAQLCIFNDFCGKGIAVERDGSAYSCDHYVYPEYKLGNIKERSLASMVFSKEQRAFGFAKRDTLPSYCKACRWLSVCNGECPKNRVLRAPDGEPGLNYLCSGLKTFFEHIDPAMRRFAAEAGVSHSPVGSDA